MPWARAFDFTGAINIEGAAYCVLCEEWEPVPPAAPVLTLPKSDRYKKAQMLKHIPIPADSRFMKLMYPYALGLIFAALIPVAPLAAQDKSDAAVSKIIALEKAWNQAYKFRDKKALTEILHDSIVLVNDDGSLQSRSGFLASIDASAPSDEQQAEPESISVYVFGDVAVATGVFRRREVKNGKSYVERDRFVDTWVSRGGSWVCVAASATSMSH
ncbi:MAG TPA: nuclear transport factor 2 family protein [Candidatus Sulfotelmatobacter sp.]|jgi:ketosteroid isomerase-like protein